MESIKNPPETLETLMACEKELKELLSSFQEIAKAATTQEEKWVIKIQVTPNWTMLQAIMGKIQELQQNVSEVSHKRDSPTIDKLPDTL